MFANLFATIVTDFQTVYAVAQTAVASVWTFFANVPETIVSIF